MPHDLKGKVQEYQFCKNRNTLFPTLASQQIIYVILLEQGVKLVLLHATYSCKSSSVENSI